jgi:DNA-binding PadR family transcriptional regulator
MSISLTLIEEAILAAIFHLGDRASGLAIREYLRDRKTGTARRSIWTRTRSSFYAKLDLLETGGLIRSSQIHVEDPERGGLRARLYVLEPEGLKALHVSMAKRSSERFDGVGAEYA